MTAHSLAYTDGLVERRGQLLDVGLDDLRRSVIGSEPFAGSGPLRRGRRPDTGRLGRRHRHLGAPMAAVGDSGSATVEGRRDSSGVLTLSIAGELDLASVESVHEAIEEAVNGNPERIVFDLGGVTFMDSSGIAMMLQVSKRVGNVESSQRHAHRAQGHRSDGTRRGTRARTVTIRRSFGLNRRSVAASRQFVVGRRHRSAGRAP